MAYCDIADVQKLIKWFEFTSTSKITDDEVTNYYIPESDTMINAILERKYIVPITDADDIEILKYISCRMTACEIAHVIVAQASGEISEIIERWCENAKKKLEMIMNETIDLPNSTKKEVDGRLYSYTAHSPNAPDPIWELVEEEW